MFDRPNNTIYYVIIVFLIIAVIVVSVLFAGYVQWGWLRKMKFVGETCETNADCGDEKTMICTNKMCAVKTIQPIITAELCAAGGLCPPPTDANTCSDICKTSVTKESCKSEGYCKCL